MKYRLIPEWPNLLLGTIFGADVPKNTESEIFFCGEIEDIAKLRVPLRSFTPLMMMEMIFSASPIFDMAIKGSPLFRVIQFFSCYEYVFINRIPEQSLGQREFVHRCHL